MRRKRTFERRQIQHVDEYSVNENAQLFFDAGFGATCGGMKFYSWIDEDSRSNGYNAGAVITNPAYIIESILRDILHVPTAKIDYASFDMAGNTSDGLLNGWSFTGGIYDVVNVVDLLDNILKQCKSQLYINPDGKSSLIVYSSASVDYTDYDFDTTNNITNLQVYQSAYENIVSEVRINFALDRATGKYRKVSFIKAKKRFSGTYLNEAIDLTEYEWNVDDGTKFQRLNAPGACTDNLAGTGAGNLSNGAYYYKVTFVTAVGETQAGTASGGVTVLDKTTNGKVALTAIPTGNSLVTSRKIYRTEADGIVFKLLATLSDNTTTTYTDNTADIDLGIATAPTANATGDFLYILTDNEINAVAEVTGNTVTLKQAAGERTAYFDSIAATHADDSQIWIIDKSSDAGDGATADTTREGYACRAIWRYNAQNVIEINADWIIDQATAVLLRNYYLDWYYIPHWIIEFDAFLRTADLKVGNIIEFNPTIMDAYCKLGGDSWSSKKFRVMSISRSGSMTFHIKAVEI